MTLKKYSRPIAKRRYKNLFIVSTEGCKTEPIYFSFLDRLVDSIHIEVLPTRRGHCTPSDVFERALKKAKSKGPLMKGDEVWLVIDRDNRPAETIEKVINSCNREKYNFAVSNPKFELWLLLHFEFPPARTINTSQDCTERLRKYISNYEKSHFDVSKIISNVNKAIERAEGNYSDFDPLSDSTGTNVHLLVKKIMESGTKP